MATTKPTKPSNEFLSTGFGGVKNDFSGTLKSTGFDKDSPQILQGDNLNFMLNTIGLQLKYLTIIADYINGINSGKVPYINGNGQLDVADINTLLPSQSGNSGKFLTTNGSACSWSNDFRIVGEPIITLDFTKQLADNECWLDGTEGENRDGVVPITGKWATLFSIYGWVYDTSYTNTSSFKLPNFTNRAIWGGTTAGYIGAGLPSLSGTTDYKGDHSHTALSGGVHTHTMENAGKHTHSQKTTDNDDFGARFTSGAAASTTKTLDTSEAGSHKHTINQSSSHTHSTNTTGSHNHNVTITSSVGVSNTVQPPAIKVRVYTRVY